MAEPTLIESSPPMQGWLCTCWDRYLTSHNPIQRSSLLWNFSTTLFISGEVQWIFRLYFVRNLRTVAAEYLLFLNYCSTMKMRHSFLQWPVFTNPELSTVKRFFVLGVASTLSPTTSDTLKSNLGSKWRLDCSYPCLALMWVTFLLLVYPDSSWNLYRWMFTHDENILMNCDKPYKFFFFFLKKTEKVITNSRRRSSSSIDFV